MAILQTILAVTFVLGVMILVHELGHFLAAKFFKVRVLAFSFGFGPRLFGRQWGETDYRVCVLPLGGYVKMAGEQPGDEHTADPREFMSKPRWQRLIIALMGPLMNMVLAVALLVGLYMVRFERLSFLGQPAVLGDVEENSPAARAGLRENDRIVAIDGHQNPDWEQVGHTIMAGANRAVPLRVDRNGARLDLAITPTLDPASSAGYAGWSEQVSIQVGDFEPGMPAETSGLLTGDILVAVDGEPIRSHHKLPNVLQRAAGRPVALEFLRDGERKSVTIAAVYHKSAEKGSSWRIGVGLKPRYDRIATRLSFPAAVRESLDQNRKNALLILNALEGIIERRLSPKALEGPIGIARLSGQAARQGPADLIILMSAISLNLGLLNLLPIPILDGGVIVLLLLESLIGRDISLAVKERIVQAGFVFLMLLFVFVIYNDIVKSLAPG